MKNRLYLAAALALTLPLHAANNQVLGWNNLGMHCMDSDYSVFSILPPYNTIEAQLIVNGALVTNGAGYTITYEAVADPSGSFNSTAAGKGNYYDYVQQLYGAALVPDQGLLGWDMPGISNTPQAMLFEVTNQPAPVSHPDVLTPVNWWRAEGIPMSPYDDTHHKNPYPLMRLIAKNGAIPIATNDIVLPISDEMDCRACHASGSDAAAEPAAGWVWDGLPERDYRLNILRLHDEKNFASNAVLYAAALAARGFNPQGLYRGVVADNHPVLCAACHASEALGTPSYGLIPQLTTSIHSFHAHVLDPATGIKLDDAANRSACYRCHPGSTTKCLRGAMGGGYCGGRLDGNAVSKLPRQLERRRRAQPHWLVHGTQLRGLPYRHRHQQQRPDPLHIGIHRHQFHSARAGQPDVLHPAEHSRRGTFNVPLFGRARRAAMRSLPRLNARGISQHAPERQLAER